MVGRDSYELNPRIAALLYVLAGWAGKMPILCTVAALDFWEPSYLEEQ